MNSEIIYHPDSVFQKTGFDSIREASIKKCYTPYGHELLEKFMPSANEKTVSHHLELASEWIHLLQSGASHPLTTVNDLRIPLKESRVEGAVLPLEDFVVILQNARLARLIKSFFGRSEFEYSALQNIVDKLIECTELEDAIRKVVTDRGELRDDASAELKAIRKRLNREKNRLRSTIQQVMKRVAKEGMTSDEGPTIRNGRMVIPIQAEFKRKVEGFIQDVSSTGQTIYIEPVQALQINNDIRQLEAEESQEIERIIRELTRKVQTFRTSLLNNCEHIAKLDAIHSKVSLGLNLDGVIPVLSDDNPIRLISRP
jgi:DNA mismatch repair protein MutS2